MSSQKETLAVILSRLWTKNWGGSDPLIMQYFYAYQTTKYLKDAIGIGISENLTVVREGFVTSYFIEEDKRRFAAYILDQAKDNPESIREWCDILKSRTDSMSDTNERLTQRTDFRREYFDELIATLYEYLVPHRVVKVIADYLPEELRATYLPLLQEARIYCEPAYDKGKNTVLHFTAMMVKESGIEERLVLSMTRDQLEAYFATGTYPDRGELERQYNNAVVYANKGSVEYLLESEAVAIVEAALSGEGRDITGQSAYPGVVKGKARVILSPSKASGFDTGDILITEMTRPEYIPFVQKAGAMVTDAGGVLSHAAITAREMKIPCITGTEIATKRIPDGAMIEVDADNGIVRLIS